MGRSEMTEIRERQRKNSIDKVRRREDEDETKEGTYMHLPE